MVGIWGISRWAVNQCYMNAGSQSWKVFAGKQGRQKQQAAKSLSPIDLNRKEMKQTRERVEMNVSICWPFVFCFSFNSPGNACQQPQEPNPGCELQMKALHSSVSQGPACWYLLQMGTPGQASRASLPPTTRRMFCCLARRHVAGWPVRYFPGRGSTSPGPSPKCL